MGEKLHMFFEEADKDGSGSLSIDELASIIEIPKVRSWLQVLGLEFHETQSLFHLLDDGDGLITVDEFVRGVGILKGQSRSIDVVRIQREVEKVHVHMKLLRKDLGLAPLKRGVTS